MVLVAMLLVLLRVVMLLVLLAFSLMLLMVVMQGYDAGGKHKVMVLHVKSCVVVVVVHIYWY